MLRKIIFSAVAIAVILLISIILSGFLTSMKPEKQMKELKVSDYYVKVEKVKYEDIKSSVSATGRVVSRARVALISEVQGMILSGNIPLKKGQSFTKGALLIKIFDKEAAFNLQGLKSKFLNAVANILPDFKIDFKGSYKSWQSFFSEVDINKDLPELPKINSDKEKIFLASREIINLYYTIKSQEIRVKKYNIYAPFNGVYVNVVSEVGSTANPGAPLANIIRTDKLELEVPVETGNAKWTGIGDQVIITTEYDNRKWNGRVVRKANFVDQRTQSISVFVSVERAGNNLLDGQYLTVTFPGRTLENVMEIPRNAVFNHNNVYVVKNNKLHKTEINIEKFNENSLLFSGLAKGADLVVEPLINANEKMEVKILGRNNDTDKTVDDELSNIGSVEKDSSIQLQRK